MRWTAKDTPDVRVNLSACLLSPRRQSFWLFLAHFQAISR